MKKTDTYDLLIVGGGIAGVAAALEATRLGLRTAVVEKTILWGGLCTSGLVPIYMPLCDGKGKQVTFGLAEELMRAASKYGPGGPPSKWSPDGDDEDSRASELYPEGHVEPRYMSVYFPPAFAMGLDELMEECGADLWLDTLACLPILEGDGIAGVEIENKSGRVAIMARQVIDCSGDADIAARAGAPCDEAGSMPSFLGYYASLSNAADAVDDASAKRLLRWFSAGANEFDKGYDGPLGVLPATNGKAVSAFIVESRKVAREKLARQQIEEGGREQVYPAVLPTQAQYRMTRAIQGLECVTTAAKNQRVETSIGCIADCRKTDAVWEVPYGALVPQAVNNLLVAGRCVSVEGYAWQVTRLIPAAVLTGQAAAVAMKLALDAKTTPAKLDPADVQRAVEARGIHLHRE